MVLTASGSLGVGTMNPKTKLDVAGKVRIADGSQGSGKLLVSDNDGIARWAAASTLGIGSGSNPNDCSATNKVVNGHSYPVTALTNGNNYMSVFVESIANGRRQWSQEFLCTKGNLGALGGERSQLFCNNGYTSNGTACIQPSADAATNCSATNMTINGKTYAVPSIKHNFSAVVYTHKAIANGTENYKQTFVCNNGTVQKSGSEEKISQTCNAGYSWNGSQCVAGGDPQINDIFKDTSCNTANIRVVTIAPGVDKIPENLNADTMYKLSAGTYEITKKINMNTCSAIVGEGNTKTTIQYAGLSFGTEDLISIAKSNAVVSDVKITGTKAGAGTVANLIKASGNISKVIIQKSNLENATQSGINFDNVLNSKIDKVGIKEIKSTSDTVNGIYLNGSSNTLTHITISNISTSSNSSSSSYGIYLGGNNNTLTNITISNISSYSSYGIYLSGGSNTFTNITISNISSSGIYFDSDNNTLSNASISYSKHSGISVENGKTNNTLRNVLVYKNGQAGIQVDGSNTTFSNVYSYANGGAGIAGNGGSNFYYDKLVIFGNAGGNTVGPLKPGLASHWLGGFTNGVFTATGTFGAAWAIAPTNVTGFNINTVGAQTGLTWPATVNWAFGANIPKQMAPVIASDCTLSATSTTKCRPTFGGTTTYNAAKKIGER
ncbi:MAG: right-handed parallel beta-helix repeat-containing protein [Candidatus Gracilibacteria bacterium]|nr:right-handed parallel beta-helix repeat-containing protein [Candidatus Gracilibacteria bacterium]